MNDKMTDDWREETQIRLKRNVLYNSLHGLCKSDPAGSHIISLLDNACYYSYQKTKAIIRHMGEYTLHDSEHSFRVLNLMGRLIPSETKDNLSVPEIFLLILSAFFHDIGMAPSENEIRAWMGDWAGDEPAEWEIDEYKKFNRFCDARPEISDDIKKLHNAGNHNRANVLEKFLVSEYIRSTHADRARSIIAKCKRGQSLIID